MGILIPLTPRLRAFGKSWTDFTDVTIYNVLKDVLKELTDRQRVIIDNVLKDTNVTIAQLAADINERTIRRDFMALQRAGILHRDGVRKDGRWVICSGIS